MTTLPSDHDSERPGLVVLTGTVALPRTSLRFSFSGSRGPGGQNVNKLETRAELRVWLAELPLPADALERMAHLAGKRLTGAGEILIVCDEHRSQSRNKDECVERLRDLVRRAIVRPRKRVRTKPSRGSIERRLKEKEVRSRTKSGRRRVAED